MRLIHLSQGSCVKVDNEDFNQVSKHTWSAFKTNPKAKTKYVSCTTNKRKVYLHRMVLGLKSGDGVVVDHKNGNGLDNRKSNLSCGTHRANHQNRTSHRKGKLLGATKRPYGRWESACRLNGNYCYIGVFSSKEEANAAYVKFINSLSNV